VLLVWCLTLLLLLSGADARSAASRAAPAGRSGPSDDERILRNLLAQYAAGDPRALQELIWRSADWSRRALDETLDRTKRALKEAERISGVSARARTDLLGLRLRADRIRVLWLCAVINLDASRRVSEVELIAPHLIEADRVIDLLYRLQTDITTFGPVPWPVDVSRSPAETSSDSAPQTTLGRQGLASLVRLWFSATVARLQELVEIGVAPDLIARGLAWFPDHAELLLARGSLAETIVALERVDDSLADGIYPRDAHARWRTILTAAGQDYQHAYELDSSLTEALVRCGRVRLLSGDAAAAGAFFDRADTDGVPARTRYLARLFRARRAQQDGRVADARTGYSSALELQPDARAPMLGLARLFDALGDTASARTWTSRVLDATGTDPWQEYLQGQAWQLDERMARLHTGKAR
jgi:tetratricopeptide (TPR) repeat protein